MIGLEPTTYALPRRCATDCATSAVNDLIIQHKIISVKSFEKNYFFNYIVGLTFLLIYCIIKLYDCMERSEESDMNRNQPSPKQNLAIYIVGSILAFFVLYFLMGDGPGYKIAAFIVPPALIVYAIFSYCKEKKADSKAETLKPKIIDGSRFSSAEWREEYLQFALEHPLEAPDSRGMKYDMLKDYHQRKSLGMMFLCGFLLVLTIAAPIGYALDNEPIPDAWLWLPVFGIPLFGVLFYLPLRDYTGYPVRKWLRRSAERLDEYEESYMKGKKASYKENGVNLGAYHVFIHTDKKVAAIPYEDLTGAVKRVVRQKNYQNDLYANEEYRHYIDISADHEGSSFKISAELNEFQAEMIITELKKIIEHSSTPAQYDETFTNEIFT